MTIKKILPVDFSCSFHDFPEKKEEKEWNGMGRDVLPPVLCNQRIMKHDVLAPNLIIKTFVLLSFFIISLPVPFAAKSLETSAFSVALYLLLAVSRKIHSSSFIIHGKYSPQNSILFFLFLFQTPSLMSKKMKTLDRL